MSSVKREIVKNTGLWAIYETKIAVKSGRGDMLSPPSFDSGDCCYRTQQSVFVAVFAPTEFIVKVAQCESDDCGPIAVAVIEYDVANAPLGPAIGAAMV